MTMAEALMEFLRLEEDHYQQEERARGMGASFGAIDLTSMVATAPYW